MQIKKKVFVLCTGGTIAMQKQGESFVPVAGYLEKAMASIPELSNDDMPEYVIKEYAQPMDSANLNPAHWYEMGQIIAEHHDAYDGFVILHGTDTMAYSASALSFILENLKKPVILTGSQLPLFETRGDARENLMGALQIASRCHIPEVCIYFNNKLLRGNRSKKIDASNFNAFASPNYPSLAKVGIDITWRRGQALKANKQKLTLQKIDDVAIATVRIFPGFSYSVLESILQLPLQALILETYGLGTAPQDLSFLQMLTQASQNDLIIVNCSQCITAKVNMDTYATGSALAKIGLISAGDMTVETVLAKLYYLFSKGWSTKKIKENFVKNLRGELTLREKS